MTRAEIRAEVLEQCKKGGDPAVALALATLLMAEALDDVAYALGRK